MKHSYGFINCQYATLPHMELFLLHENSWPSAFFDITADLLGYGASEALFHRMRVQFFYAHRQSIAAVESG